MFCLPISFQRVNESNLFVFTVCCNMKHDKKRQEQNAKKIIRSTEYDAPLFDANNGRL